MDNDLSNSLSKSVLFNVKCSFVQITMATLSGRIKQLTMLGLFKID